jgi:hypothetical protein
MLPISSAELAQIQQDLVDAVCDKSCVIKRPVTTQDAWGTQSDPTLPVISPPDLMCGMNQPSAGQLANYSYIIGALSAWQIRLPVGTNIQELDLITVEGQTLTVQVLLDLHSYPGLLTVLCSEIRE